MELDEAMAKIRAILEEVPGMKGIVLGQREEGDQGVILVHYGAGESSGPVKDIDRPACLRCVQTAVGVAYG